MQYYTPALKERAVFGGKQKHVFKIDVQSTWKAKGLMI